jgi:glycerol-3-phosphate cytidylyltransferase
MDRHVNGFTCGAFDLLHPGHLHLLTKAQEECDYLFVGLHTDPSIDRPEKNKPVQTTFERYMQLREVRSIDQIIPYDTETDLFNILATLDIQKRFIGSDYMYKSFTGKNLCEDRNIEIIYVPRLHSWSSSELRERMSSK